MTHVCPACGKQWECSCDKAVIKTHRALYGAHHIEIACSEKCAHQLAALLVFLARNGR
jgi:hypothetical protein